MSKKKSISRKKYSAYLKEYLDIKNSEKALRARIIRRIDFYYKQHKNTQNKTIKQQIENIDFAEKNKIKYHTMAYLKMIEKFEDYNLSQEKYKQGDLFKNIES